MRRTANKNKQGIQKEERVKWRMPDLGVMLPEAAEPPPTQFTEFNSSKSRLHIPSEIPETVAGVLDMVQRQNDKEGRSFMKLHGEQIKNNILY